MDILHEIFWAYREGKLSVKPPKATDYEDAGIDYIVGKYKMTVKQANEFQSIVYTIYSQIEEASFCAGFKVALSLIAG